MAKSLVTSSSGSSIQVMQTLAWLRKQGFRPVPLNPRSKAAISRDYVLPSYKPPGDELWQRNDYGVGVVTGPAHGGPVDADLDCPEAIYFAQVFFPVSTALFGRETKQASHLLYRVEAASFGKVAFIDPVDNSTILELRGDGGHQTVMPGSLHQDTGELIGWTHVPFPDVPIVQSDVLIRAARKVALATLLVRHIWMPGYHNEPAKHLAGMFYYLDWPVEEACEVIQAVMDATNDTDKSRIPTVRATYRRAEKGGKVSGAGVLRKQLKNDSLVDRLLELIGSPTVNLLTEYNEKFAVVNFSGKFRIADFDVQPGEPPTFWKKEDFASMMATDFSDVKDDKGRPVPKHKVWLASARRRTYRQVDFLPGETESSALNLWTGWATEPVKGDCSGWLELLEDVICGGDTNLSTWLVNWFANILIEPMNKPLTAPVIIGIEGAGKSLLMAYFGEILGRAYVSVTKDDHIHGKFNAHMATALLLHSEEALYAGDKKHAGIVRSLITDRTNMLELKGVDAKQVRSYLRLVITSNDLYAAPVKPGDRRYNIFDMGDRKLDPSLMEKVIYELGHGGPSALHHFLTQQLAYDAALPRTNIKNEALGSLKSINLPSMETWWLNTLQHGQILPDYLAWATQKGPDSETLDWPETVSSVALYTAMMLRGRETNARGLPNETLFALNLNKFTGTKLTRSQRSYENPMLEDWPQAVKLMNSRQNSILNMPSLEVCRSAFESHLEQKIDWASKDERKPVKQAQNAVKF